MHHSNLQLPPAKRARLSGPLAGEVLDFADNFHLVEPVSRTFHEVVPTKEASFSITIPRNYLSVCIPGGQTHRRRFCFSELYITPGFYSQRALQLGVDGDSEKSMEAGEYSLAIGYIASPNLYFTVRGGGEFKEDPFDQGNAEAALGNILTRINAHFEAVKPVGFKSAPFFLDWVDTEWRSVAAGQSEGVSTDVEEEDDVFYDPGEEVTAPTFDPDKFVPDLTQTYYETDNYDAAIHFNALEPSVRLLTGANNYLFPTTVATDPDLLARIRIRMHVAPNINMQFSSNRLLDALGFTADQYGRKGLRNRYHINNRMRQYRVITAQGTPQAVIPASTSRIICKSAAERFAFDPHKVTFTVENLNLNAEVFTIVRRALAAACTKSNMEADIRYSTAGSKFEFVFPQNTRMSVFFVCDPRLAERLGYGSVNRITQNLVPSAVQDKTSTVDAEALSKAIVLDAGMAIVTLDSSGSIDTYGVDDYAMCSMWPNPLGIFEISDRFNRSVYLPNVGAGQSIVTLKFNISTVKKGSVTVPLCWPIPFLVAGTLEGRVL